MNENQEFVCEEVVQSLDTDEPRTILRLLKNYNSMVRYL